MILYAYETTKLEQQYGGKWKALHETFAVSDLGAFYTSNKQTRKDYLGYSTGTIHQASGYLRKRLPSFIKLPQTPKNGVWMAHRLVWAAFKGEIPLGYEIDHINHDRQDNRLENLQCLLMKYNRVKKLKQSDKVAARAAMLDTRLEAYHSLREQGWTNSKIASAFLRHETSLYHWLAKR